MMSINKHKFLALALASVVLAVSCSKETPVAPVPEPQPEPRPETEPSADTLSPLHVVADGRSRYSVVCSSDAPQDVREAAVRIVSVLREYSDTAMALMPASVGEDALEIIVGADAYAPAMELYRQITYGSGMLCRCGRKILVSALDSDSYDAVFESLSESLARCYDKKSKSLVLDDRTFGKQSVKGVGGYIPPFKVDKMPQSILQTGSVTNEDVAMQVDFSGCGDSDFDSYCSALEDAGYQLGCDNAFGKCRYATYVNADYQIGVSLYNENGVFRIVSEPAYDKPLWTIGGTPGKVKPLMMQPWRDGSVIPLDDHYSAFVIRLSDGRFVVYDTGSPAVPDQMMQFMHSKNTFADGKVHIAMIMISHPHGDHYGGLPVFADKYASEIVCEAVAFNYPNHTRQNEFSIDDVFNQLLSSAEKLGARCYCLRAGMAFDLGGARFEVLFTPDELGSYYLGGIDPKGKESSAYATNNTSNIVRFTIEGQKITFVGDCYNGEAGIFNETVLGSFESDIMSAAHHGFNLPPTEQMYVKAQPVVIFWPDPKGNYGSSRSFDYTLMHLDCVKKHFFEDEPAEIELPYWPE